LTNSEKEIIPPTTPPKCPTFETFGERFRRTVISQFTIKINITRLIDGKEGKKARIEAKSITKTPVRSINA
jgi:hypothetical protein